MEEAAAMQSFKKNYQKYNNLKVYLDSIFIDSVEVQRVCTQILRYKQGTKTALEFFTQFERLRFIAQYGDSQNEVLMQILGQNVNDALIDKILNSFNIPETYEE